jgi:hypothetical protein
MKSRGQAEMLRAPSGLLTSATKTYFIQTGKIVDNVLLTRFS